MSRTARRWLLITFLLFVVITLAVVAFWPERQKKAPPPLVAGYSPDQVKRLEIFHGETRMRFEREAQAWRMVSPYPLLASRPNVERVLDLPLEKSHRRYPAQEVDLGELGLQPPKATVRLDGFEIRFGRQHPLELRRYVQIGDVVHLIDDTLFFLLTSPPTFWLDHRLIPEGKIEGLRLPGLTVHQTEKGGWQSSPELDDEKLREIVEAWQHAHAVEITPFAEKPPKAPEILVETDLGMVRFRLLAKTPETLLLREDLKLQFHLLPETAEKLRLRDAGTAGS